MTTVAELEVVIGADTGEVEKGLKKTSDQIKDLGDDSDKTSRKFKAAMAAMGGAALAIGGAAANAAMEFETSFAEVRKTVDATETEFAALEKTLRSMASDTTNPLSALDNSLETLTGIAAMAGSLGVATDDIDDFVQVVGAMTVATDLSAESAANFAARFANVTGMDMGNLGSLGDTIVELGNKMAATESEIAAFANRLATMATFGFSPDEILAYSAAMASLGLSSELGSTNLNKTIMDINQAVAEDGGKLQVLADAVGMTADEFAELNSADPNGAFLKFLEALNGMDATTQLQTLKDMGITSAEQVTTMLKLAAGYETVHEAMTIAGKAWTDSNALMDEATKKADTTAAGFSRIQNKLNEVAITIGGRMLPGINKATEAFGQMIDKMGEGDLGGALAEAPGIIEGIGRAVAGAFGQESGFNAFVQGIEDGALALQIILDRIIRSIEIWAADANLRLVEFIAGFRQTILDATSGQIDIAPDIRMEQGALMAQLADLRLGDEITQAIYRDLQDGSIDLSQALSPDSPTSMNISELLTLYNDFPDQLARIADGMGFEAKHAFENAINVAFSAGDMKTVELMLPLAIEADMNLDDIKANIQEKLSTLATGDTEGIDIPMTFKMADAMGMDTTGIVEKLKESLGIGGQFQLDMGDLPTTAVPTIIDNELFYTNMRGEMVSAITGRIFNMTADVDAEPNIDPAFVTEAETWVETNTYSATITVDITAVPGSVNTSALEGAVASGSVSAPATKTGNILSVGGAPPFHTGGTYTPPGGGQEGLAWLKRGETVRTTAQESALDNRTGGGNTYVIYGSSPYEVAEMVERANRERGR